MACQDSQEPPPPQSLSDPAAVVTELAQVDSAFASPVCSTYERSSFQITNPLAGALPPAPIGRLIAEEWLGATFEWVAAPNYRYVATNRPGAPPTGVRFILNRLNAPGTTGPVEPRIELGYVDFLDESSGNAPRLHVRVRSVDGLLTCLDYTADINRINWGEDFTATANGTMNNGYAGAAAKSLSFTASWNETGYTRTSNASYSSSSPPVSVTLSDRTILASSTELDFRLSRPGEVVRIAGTQRWDFPSPDSASFIVTVNGGMFARGEGDVLLLLTWMKYNNAALTDAELRALYALEWRAFNVFIHGDYLRAPIRKLFAQPFPD